MFNFDCNEALSLLEYLEFYDDEKIINTVFDFLKAQGNETVVEDYINTYNLFPKDIIILFANDMYINCKNKFNSESDFINKLATLILRFSERDSFKECIVDINKKFFTAAEMIIDTLNQIMYKLNINDLISGDNTNLAIALLKATKYNLNQKLQQPNLPEDLKQTIIDNYKKSENIILSKFTKLINECNMSENTVIVPENNVQNFNIDLSEIKNELNTVVQNLIAEFKTELSNLKTGENNILDNDTLLDNIRVIVNEEVNKTLAPLTEKINDFENTFNQFKSLKEELSGMFDNKLTELTKTIDGINQLATIIDEQKDIINQNKTYLEKLTETINKEIEESHNLVKKYLSEDNQAQETQQNQQNVQSSDKKEATKKRKKFWKFF
jgi:hypothetical protein